VIEQDAAGEFASFDVVSVPPLAQLASEDPGAQGGSEKFLRLTPWNERKTALRKRRACLIAVSIGVGSSLSFPPCSSRRSCSIAAS
jgi:hypothetical protein